MNVFNFLVALCACGGLVGTAWILTRKPLNIRIIHKHEMETYLPQEQPAHIKEEPKQENTPEVPVATASMDAVIGAVNELMGVSAKEDEVDGR
jgi:hypothetical protein